MIKNKTMVGGSGSTSTAYVYDSLDRLVHESTSTNGSSLFDSRYSYDLAGNRLMKTINGIGVAYTLGTGNRLASSGTIGVIDIQGSSTEPIGTDDRWGELWVSNITAQVGWVPEIDGCNFWIDNLLAMTVYGATATNTYYAIKDHQNTVIALTDSTGSVVETYEYDAWGNTRVFDASGSELTTSALGNRYTFQGREIDWNTGLIYFRARWYDPETGRWLSKDPIGIAGGLNQYVFCANNPANFTDPYGEDWSVGGSEENVTDQIDIVRHSQIKTV